MFLSVHFMTLASSVRHILAPISVEMYWLFISERYYDPLLLIENKIAVYHPSAPLSLLFYWAKLNMSHTIGLERFTPEILASARNRDSRSASTRKRPIQSPSGCTLPPQPDAITSPSFPRFLLNGELIQLHQRCGY